MANTVTNPGARLAGLLADLGLKLKVGNISEEEFALFLKRQNPFTKTVLTTVLASTFMTATYFVTKPGLYVSEEFTSRITATYSNALVPQGLDGIGSFDLPFESSDKTILAWLGGKKNVRKHAFTPDQIAALIDLQPQGVEGKLLVNGCANLFHVVGAGGQLFVVHVYWRADPREWVVDAWKLGGVGYWHFGARVFRNTQVLKA